MPPYLLRIEVLFGLTLWTGIVLSIRYGVECYRLRRRGLQRTEIHLWEAAHVLFELPAMTRAAVREDGARVIYDGLDLRYSYLHKKCGCVAACYHSAIVTFSLANMQPNWSVEETTPEAEKKISESCEPCS